MSKKGMKNGRLWVQEWLNLRKMRTFAKNTAHNERRLLNFSYICTVAGKPSQTNEGSV